MERKTLGVAVVGCGLMGSIHAKAYAQTRGCRIIGFVNRTPDKAQQLAARFGGTCFPNLDALLADPRVDAVSICTDQQVHAAQIVAAASAGKHILAEKPLALTRDELDEIDTAVRQSGVTLMVGHQLRFHPVVAAVRKAMRRLGGIFHLDLEWAFRLVGHEGRCWSSYRTGGFFMELGVHLTDLAAHLMGPIRHISGHTLRLNEKRITEDYTHALLQFESAAVGSLIVSANHRTKRQGLLQGRMIGARGRIDFSIYPYKRAFNAATLTLDRGKSLFVADEVREKLTWPDRSAPVAVYPGYFDVYQQEIEAFVRAVRRGVPPPIPLDEGRRAIEVILGVYDAQGRASAAPNFQPPPGTYQNDAASHPLLAPPRGAGGASRS